MADLSSYINITANTVTTSNLSATGNVVSSSVISTTGNITGNYILGNGSQLTGLSATYGNANVVANLAALGSNPVSTTGNITGGNLSVVGSIIANNITGYGNIIFNQTLSTQGGSDMSLIPGTGLTRSYGNFRPYFANTYDLGGSSTRWNNVYANVTNSVTHTAIGNVTGGNLLTGGVVSATGNITGNYILGNGSQLTGLPATYGNANVVANLAALGSNPVSTTGNIDAGNITLSGNLTVNGAPIYGAPASFAKYTRTTTQTGIVANTVVVCNVLENSFGSDITVNTSTGNVTLAPNNTYRLRGTPGALVSSGSQAGGAWRWYNATTSTYVGEIGTSISPAASNYNTGANDTAEVVITPNVTTVLQLQMVAVSNMNTIGGATSIEGGYPWIDVEVIGGQAPITAFSTTGNVTGNYFIGNGSQLTGLPATYGNSNVSTFLAAFGSNTVSTTGNVTSGNLIVVGTATTGINAVLAGPSFTPLANTSAGFVANVNNYTQVTFQNKSTGADATADYILTADNGSDTVNYGDFGIINSGYDNGTPTNSLGNIVFAGDTYLYAQGNTGNASQSGGNLAIGTTVPGKTVKIFAGGANNNSLIANISNTGMSVTGNVTASNFVGNISITGNVTGTSANVSLVAGSFTATFDNTGVLTLPTNGGDEGGEIRLGIPATNTTLQNRVTVDVYQDRFRIFEGSANAKGAYIDLSQSAAGVGTLLNNRVGAANLALNTSLTLDNLAVQIKTQGSGVWIFLATVSGSATYQYAITYQLGGGGLSNPQGTTGTMSATTTPATVGINSWYFSVAGYQATTILTDTTASKMYRVTWQTTTGSSPYGNFVSIERLV